LVLSIGIVGLCGYLVYRYDGLASRFTDLAYITRARTEWEFTPAGGPALKPFVFAQAHFVQPSANGKRKVLFVGDSNAEQYWSRVDELIKKDPAIVESVTFKTGGGCLPIPDVSSDIEAHCDGLAQKAIEYALASNVDTVVFAADWWAYFEGAVGYYIRQDGAKYKLNEAHGSAIALQRLGTMVSQLRSAGRTVFVILNIPIGQEFDPRSMLHRTVFGIERRPGIPVHLSHLLARYGKFEEQLKAVAIEAGAKVIVPTEWLCVDDLCPVVDGAGEPVYMDATHLRPAYVRKRATFVDAVLGVGVNGKAPAS
jgi:hypothetical protein